MSLTWAQAAHQADWWTARQRGDVTAYKRHVQQIADAHGVSPVKARHAYVAVADAMRRGEYGHKATRFGFASQPGTDAHGDTEMRIPDDHDIHDYEGPARWGHLDTQDVNLRHGVHATQEGITPRMVAHNLFHPGKLMPTERHNVGNPDYDPDEEDASSRAHADGVEMHSDQSRFYRPEHGPTYTADGHHRVAADLLLGKTHTKGLVWDDSKPPAKTCDDPSHGPCQEKKAFRQEFDAPWPPDPSSHKAS